MTNSTQIGNLKDQLESKTPELKGKEAGAPKQENRAQPDSGAGKIDFAVLKAEIAASAGLILKIFPEASPVVSEKTNPSSILSDFSSFFKTYKLPTIVKKLKSQNISLAKRFQLEQKERKAILREKSILIAEIKRLRGNPVETEALNKTIAELEKRSRANGLNHENLLQEKNRLATVYSEAVKEISRGKENVAESAKIIDELNSDLTVLQIEKENLEFNFSEIKQNFNKKLTEKAKKIEAEYEDKIQNLRRHKNRVAQFSNNVMDEDTPGWMITYADMVTLLLTFFILYYSIAAQNLMKFKEVIFGEEKANIGLIELVDTMKIRTSLNEWTGFQKNALLNDIEKVGSEQITLNSGQNKSRIVVRIPGRTLFKPGSAELEKAGWPSLTEIANIFKKYPDYKINIQGHTDDYPVDSVRFPTNWELSATRATAVLRFLNDKGIDPIRMTATGYADTFPIGPNTTADERAKNRRVEFVLEKIK